MIFQNNMITETLILLSFFVLVYLYLKFKEDVKYQTILALSISFVWVRLNDMYEYINNNYSILGLNIFPFVLWSLGLVLFKELTEYIESNFKFKSKINFWIYITIIWITLILLVEIIGYNIFGIKLNSNYQGLFGLPLLHTHTIGKIYYLTIGVVFVAICKLLKIK